MADPHRLIQALGGVKSTRAAVITTYNASFPFFEHVVLRRLQSVGCSHVVLFIDDRMLRQAMASEHRRPRLAGVEYTLIPMRYPGAFHAKVLLQVGERQGRVWVGSHNLTLAGFNHNRELTTYASSRTDPDARRLVNQAWSCIRRWGVESGASTEALDQVEHLAPWLAEPSEDGDDAVLASNVGNPLWPQLRPRLPDRIRRVVVVGPFFDGSLAFLHHLADTAPDAEIVVGLRAHEAMFPAEMRHGLPSRVRLVDASQIGPQNRSESYLHAKAILVEGEGHSLLIAGSANPSAPAFLKHPRGNAEAVAVRILRGGSDPLGLRALLDAPVLDDAAWIDLPTRHDEPTTETGPRVWTVTLDGKDIDPFPGVPPYDCALFVGEAGTVLARTPMGDSPALHPPDRQLWPRVRWIRLEVDGDTVGVLIVHHRRRLARLARNRKDLKLTDALRSLETRVPDLSSVLALLGPILDQPTKRRATTQSKSTKRGSAGIGIGGADAAVVPDSTDELYGTEGDLAEVMLYVHHRLGAQIDTLERSEEELVGSDDEALLAPTTWVPTMEDRERVRGRFTRIRKKLGRVLEKPRYEPTSMAHDRIAKLSAILGLSNATVRTSTPELRQNHDHLRLAPVEDLGRLLYDGLASAYFNHDLTKAGATLGVFAEEVRSVPPLLAWLCQELVLRPPKPTPRTRRRLDTVDLAVRAVWVTLFPRLDEDHWDRLIELVRASDGSDDVDDWLDEAQTWTRHMHRVMANPEPFLEKRRKPMPGDMVMLGGGRGAVLRVVHEEIGGPSHKRRVVWPAPNQEYGTRMFPNAWPLKATVWQP